MGCVWTPTALVLQDPHQYPNPNPRPNPTQPSLNPSLPLLPCPGREDEALDAKRDVREEMAETRKELKELLDAGAQ